LAADFINGVVNISHYMEFIENNAGVGQIVSNSLDECFGQINAGGGDFSRIALVGGKVGCK
jgi:hypothetical protein